MSTATQNTLSVTAERYPTRELPDALCATPWENLCAWLTRDLHNMEVTIERRSKAGEWIVDCVSYPLEKVATRETPNGSRVISICVRIDGKTELFEVPGPNSLGVHRNAAGWPIRIELGYEEGQLVLIFSGQMDPQRRSGRNFWG